jgi:hypothetical protein
MKTFSKAVRQKLQHYVYALIDPRDATIFYVGKASANDRAWSHTREAPNKSNKSLRIQEIRREGLEPQVEVLRYGLTEKSVLEVEAAVIDTLGFETLTNVVRGHGIERGRLGSSELERLYGAKPIELSTYSEPIILFFITQSYSPTLSRVELYDSVRQFWKIGAHARTVDISTGELPFKLAVGVADSVAVAVYSIEAWLPANSTVSTRHCGAPKNRWEFVGQELIDHPFCGRLLHHNGEKVVAVQCGFTYR